MNFKLLSHTKAVVMFRLYQKKRCVSFVWVFFFFFGSQGHMTLKLNLTFKFLCGGNPLSISSHLCEFHSV